LFGEGDLGHLAWHGSLRQGHGLVRPEGHGEVLTGAGVQVAHRRRELHLRVLRPLEPHALRLGVVRHCEVEGAGLVDEAVTKPDQIWLGSCIVEIQDGQTGIKLLTCKKQQQKRSEKLCSFLFHTLAI